MKQRENFLVNMCHAQLLSWCLAAMLQALGLNCGRRNPEGVRMGTGAKDAVRVSV